MEADEQAPVVLEGPLIKRGERVQNWKKRHMELRGSTIFYFAHKGDTAQKGTIPLHGVDVREIPESRFRRQFVFEISHPARRSYFLQAASPASRVDWVRATQQAGAGGAAPAANAANGVGGPGYPQAGGSFHLAANLPPLSSARTDAQCTQLLRQKLALCSRACVFDAPEDAEGEAYAPPEQEAAQAAARKARADIREKKREALLEVVEFCGTHAELLAAGDAALFGEVVEMVGANLFRALPPRDALAGEEDDEDEPFMELRWPHLSIVYELLLRLVVMAEVPTAPKKRIFDMRFIISLVTLFSSQDLRERDYLKTIVHRLYGKLTQRRGAMRRVFRHTFHSFVLEPSWEPDGGASDAGGGGSFARPQQPSGICEILEILASIINGFAVPIKAEHLKLLERTLVPMHTAPSLEHFHAQLAYCMVQFVAKDPALTVPIFKGLLRFWPELSSTKCILFLNEIDELFDYVASAELLEPVFLPVLRRVNQCIGSVHFQIAERALQLWQSPRFVELLVEERGFYTRSRPVLLPTLQSASMDHWNEYVPAPR
eukprot:g204.t1